MEIFIYDVAHAVRAMTFIQAWLYRNDATDNWTIIYDHDGNGIAKIRLKVNA